MNIQITLAQAKELFVTPSSIATSAKSNIDVLDSVFLEIKDHIATVIGTDSQSLIRKKIDVNIEGEFSICIEAKKLQAVLQGYDDDKKTITFDFSTTGKVKLKYGRSL